MSINDHSIHHNLKFLVMLRNISSLGNKLNKNEQKSIAGGLKREPDICGINFMCGPGYRCANRFLGDLLCVPE